MTGQRREEAQSGSDWLWNMKLLVAFSILLALGLGSNLRYDELKFAQFKEKFGKQYQTRSDIYVFL